MLTVAPGMSAGMTFEVTKTNPEAELTKIAPPTENAMPTVINLTDILTQDFDDLGDWDKDEEEEKDIPKEVRWTLTGEGQEVEYELQNICLYQKRENTLKT